MLITGASFMGRTVIDYLGKELGVVMAYAVEVERTDLVGEGY